MGKRLFFLIDCGIRAILYFLQKTQESARGQSDVGRALVTGHMKEAD
jgi:hypothetical protein